VSRNMKNPQKKPDRPMVVHPGMPNIYTGPYGTPPTNQAVAPYWYMQSRDDEPIRGKALRDAFQQAAKPMQQRVNRQRRPSDAMRGY